MTPNRKTPPWFEGELPPRSFRSIFKWGATDQYKHPNKGLVALMKERLNVSDEQLRQPVSLGLAEVSGDYPGSLTAGQIGSLAAIVGEANIQSDTYARLRASYGQGMIDSLRLREGIIENIPDIVLHPRHTEDVAAIIAYCHAEKIPVYVVSGRSSVTRGYEAVRGGATLDMSTHMNQVIRFNETNQTITVQPGIFGPALEKVLNNAPQTLGAKRAYTCGHFPQSFEYSTVGGWALTRGAGQNSTYYGKAEDLVLSQEYITPVGRLKTQDYPRQATGPDIDQILIGSEGAFGVLAAVTLKVFRHTPQNRRHFSFMFKDWEAAQAAARAIMQAEAGYPSVFRISDAEETDVAMHLYGIAGSPAESALNLLGFRPGEKCLMLGYTDGERGFSRNLEQVIKRTCKSHGAFNLSAFGVTKRWEHGRFSDPYLRDSLADVGVLIDTLECAVTWDSLPQVHAGVRAAVKSAAVNSAAGNSRAETICMTHLSHAYPQGGNLYFIFIIKYAGIEAYLKLQYSVLEAILQNGAAISHHHGVGKQLAPWLPEQVGEEHMNLLRSIKAHFDPHNIMNPGGTLGLDMNPAQANKNWGIEANAGHLNEKLNTER